MQVVLAALVVVLAVSANSIELDEKKLEVDLETTARSLQGKSQ